MWKRFQTPTRQRDTIIGAPVLLHTTFDESKLGAIPHVSEVRHGLVTPVTTPDSSKRLDGSDLTELPLLPFQPSESPSVEPTRPLSDILTASSMYSQPSPDLRRPHPTRPGVSVASSVYSEVSPPSSPDNYTGSHFGNRRRSPSISPVDEKHEGFGRPAEGPSNFTSQIPVLRRPKEEATTDVQNPLGLATRKPLRPTVERDSSATRWTDFLKEPKADSPRSQREDFTWNAPEETRFGTSVTISGGPDPNEPGSKVVKASRRPFGLGFSSNNAAEDRKVVSGRQVKASSLDKKLPAAPFGTIGLGSSETLKSQRESTSGRGTPSSVARAGPPGKSAVSLQLNQNDEDEVRPPAPLKAGRNSPPHVRSASSGLSLNPTAQPLPASEVAQADVPSSSFEKDFRRAMVGLNLEDHPPSRFSFSTYATETTHEESSPNTPEPNATSVFSSPSPTLSILNRPRPPIGSPDPDARSIKRKPAPSHHQSSSSTSTITAGLSKRLPQSPPASEPVDLITSLQSQTNVLALRRAGLNNMIRNLTEGLPQHQSSVSARETVRKQVDACKDELAEVQKQEHTLGLRLHRAYKRKDSQDIYEPTGLWVRRVTD